jgi:hypothetical protein
VVESAGDEKSDGVDAAWFDATVRFDALAELDVLSAAGRLSAPESDEVAEPVDVRSNEVERFELEDDADSDVI